MFTRQQAFKEFEELTFRDDFMFCKVLQKNETITKNPIQLITGIRIGGILKLESQEDIRLTWDGKGVRLDVYSEDDQRIFDIEMQTITHKDVPRRSRYYQSVIDGSSLSRGEGYSSLKDSYVIFIMLQDPFSYGGYRYDFQYWCTSHDGFPMGDGTHKIFLNAGGDLSDAPSDMQALLSYIKSGVPTDPFTESIEEQVQDNRRDKEMNHDYWMKKLVEYDNREIGREEGFEQGCIQAGLNVLLKGMSLQDAVDISEIPAGLLLAAYKDRTGKEYQNG